MCAHPALWDQTKWEELQDEARVGMNGQQQSKRAESSDGGDIKPSKSAADKLARIKSVYKWELAKARAKSQSIKCASCRMDLPDFSSLIGGGSGGGGGIGSSNSGNTKHDELALLTMAPPWVTRCGHALCARCCQENYPLFYSIHTGLEVEGRRKTRKGGRGSGAMVSRASSASELVACRICREALSWDDICEITSEEVLSETAHADESGDEALPDADEIIRSKDRNGGQGTTKQQMQLDTSCDPKPDPATNGLRDIKFHTSTKVSNLIHDLLLIQNRKWHTHPYFEFDRDKFSEEFERIESEARRGVVEKSVVFSQWTRLLDLIEPGLVANKIRFTRLDGTMPLATRNTNLRKFE
ncbi:hypothetical protein EV182_006794, partial [Spiromyces aspiralis]